MRLSLSQLTDEDLERQAAELGGQGQPDAASETSAQAPQAGDSDASAKGLVPKIRSQSGGGGCSGGVVFPAASRPRAPELLGDFAWFVRPTTWKNYGAGPMQGPHAQQAQYQRFQAAYEKVPQAGDDLSAALVVVSAALGCEVTEAMRKVEKVSLFSEASRLLFAVLGFSCEGVYPAALRGRALSRGAQSPVWQGVGPQALLGQWFNLPYLVTVFGGAALRSAFDACSARRCRAQFVCGLSRAAFLEIGQQEHLGGRSLRVPWAKVFERFPEVSSVRALCAHVRGRCWEDPRDRSRSRSRSRGRKKKEKKEKEDKNAVPPDCTRLFVKGCGALKELHLERHFGYYGPINEVTVLYDKKTQKSRGLAFVTLQAKGVYKGKKNTPDDVRDWILGDTHIVGGLKLEVTEADIKRPEDEERKREARVEERRKARVERDQRLGKDTSTEERLVLSPWARRWRQELLDSLPKEYEGPAMWQSPKVVDLCMGLWGEITDHVSRSGGDEAQEALALFAADETAQQAGKEWAYVPAADMLLIVGQGIIGITAEGLFANAAAAATRPPGSTGGGPAGAGAGDRGEPPGISSAVPPPPNFDKASMKTLQIANTVPTPPPAPVAVAAAAAQVPQAVAPGGGPGASAPGAQGSGPRVGGGGGGTEREKIFVGGLTPMTTLEMLREYFQRYGNIVDSVVMMDKLTGKPRGFGFVVFDNMDSVEAVLRDYSIHRVNNKWVEVKRAMPQDDLAAPSAQQQSSGAGGSSSSRSGSAPVNAPPPPVVPSSNSSGAGGGPGTFTQVPPPDFGRQPPPRASPPPAAVVPQHSFTQMPPPNFGQVPPPNFGQAPPPSFGQVPPPNFGQVQPPNFGQAPPQPSFGQVPPQSFGQVPPVSFLGAPPRKFAEA